MKKKKESPEQRKERLAPFGKMTTDELIEHFIESPEFRIEFMDVDFDDPGYRMSAYNEMALYIRSTYPDSPIQKEMNALWLMTEGHPCRLELRIDETLREGAKDIWLTNKEAAKRAGVNKGRITQLCDNKTITCKGPKGKRRISQNSLDRYTASRVSNFD